MYGTVLSDGFRWPGYLACKGCVQGWREHTEAGGSAVDREIELKPKLDGGATPAVIAASAAYPG